MTWEKLRSGGHVPRFTGSGGSGAAAHIIAQVMGCVWMLLGCNHVSLPNGGCWRPKMGDVRRQSRVCIAQSSQSWRRCRQKFLVQGSLPTCPYASSYTWWKTGSFLNFSQGVGQLQFREVQCELPVSTRRCFARSYPALAVC